MNEARFSVWVGGVEVNTDLLTHPMAVRLAEIWREDGYEDVVIDEYKGDN